MHIELVIIIYYCIQQTHNKTLVEEEKTLYLFMLCYEFRKLLILLVACMYNEVFIFDAITRQT